MPKMKKKDSAAETSSIDKALFLHKIVPSEASRPTNELFDEISKTILRFVMLEKHQADAVTLWVVMTYMSDCFENLPLALINAPERACGKSLLLTVMEKLVRAPLQCANITIAALFRTLNGRALTLLVDEADTFVAGKPELHGILNAGYARDGCVIRAELVKDEYVPTAYSVYGPKLLAGISLERHLPEATMSRAIVLALRRKLKDETVERLRDAEPDLFKGLKADISRFVQDHAEQVRLAKPDMPSDLSDREQDNWEPLFAIAMSAGQEWLDRAKRAAAAMSGASDAPQSTSNNLLSDIRELLESHEGPTITSAELLQLLTRDPEMGWDTYNRGQPFSARQLAKNLRVYDIKPKTVRISANSTPKGYEVREFDDAFERYLAPPSEPQGEVDGGTSPPLPADGAGEASIKIGKAVAGMNVAEASAAVAPSTPPYGVGLSSLGIDGTDVEY